MTSKSSIILILIILLGLYLRLFNYVNTLNMDTDQAAAFLIADRIINGGNRLLVGPLTSIWQINLLPPTYYYLVTFFYFIFRSEILVSLIFTVFGVLNILFMFFLAREMFNVRTALISALLLSVSAEMVWYSRNIWEPYLVPMTVTLSLYLLFLSRRRYNFWLYLLSIIIFFAGFLYISSILILPVYFFLALRVFKKIKSSTSYHLIKTALFFFLALLIFYSPVLIYEYKHYYPSFAYLAEVLNGNSQYISFSYHQFFSSLFIHGDLFFRSLFIFINNPLIKIYLILLLILSIYSLVKKGENSRNLVILIFFLASIIFTGIYRQKIEVHRLAALYPIFFLFYAAIITQNLHKISGLIIIIGLFYYIFSNILALSEIITFKEMNKFATPFKVAGKILLSGSYRNFTIYTLTPEDKSNHHSTSYWWALERLTQKKLISLNKSGNWIKQELDLNKDSIYLICRDFTDIINLNKECLDYFIATYLLDQPVASFQVNEIYIFQFKNNSI